MRSESIVKFRHERESSPPGRWLISTAVKRALRSRDKRCHTRFFGREFSSQLESLSPFECLRNLLKITSLREVAYAAA